VSKQKAEFWFDPICPWAWMTSRWILEVEKVRDIDVTFNIFSLAHLNRETTNEKYKDNFPKSWRTTRVIMAAKQTHGQEVVLPMYTAIGTRIHLKKMEVGQQLLTEALAEVGLPSNLVERMDDESLNPSIIESHERGISLVGNDVGTPLIKVGDVAFFGPVISPAPKGEAAGKLWDGVVNVASYPGFFEIKRSRTVGPIFD
jgi:protein-disulfide isomerase-like protein with CxxC motif